MLTPFGRSQDTTLNRHYIQIAREFGVTRERIRQIEAKALERIRFHERAKQLKSY